MDYLFKPMLPESQPIQVLSLDRYVRKAEHLDYHPHYELYFCPRKTPQTVVINGETRLITVSDIILCSPYAVHIMTPEDPAATTLERYVVYFNERFFENFSRSLFPAEWFEADANTVFFPGENAEELLQILKNCYRDSVGIWEQGAFFAAFLLALNRVVPKENREVFRNTKSEIPKILEFIHHNLDGDLSFPRITREFGISRAKLDRDFRSSTGQSLHQAVMDCRLSAAVRLLKETDLPVREIARRCGFANEYYFYAFFRRQTGITPSALRHGKNG